MNMMLIKSKIINLCDYIFEPVYIVSYPKAGRTWLRLLLATLFFRNLSVDEKVEITRSTRKSLNYKTVFFTHSHHLSPSKIKDKSLKAKKIILLIRDPKDVVVSSFFEHTKRTGGYDKNKDISDFIRDNKFGIKKIIEFYNEYFSTYRDEIKLIVKYEDLHNKPKSVLKQLMHILVVNKKVLYNISDNKINKAIDACEFSKLKKEAEKSTSPRLKPYDIKDPESQKFRKGKIGAYAKYFNEEDLEYLDRCTSKLSHNLY
jgi:hypothetical protein